MRHLIIQNRYTNRSKNLQRYFIEVDKEPLVTQTEEIELAERIQNGDTIAIEKLVKANLRFVISVAKQYQERGLPLDDLINAGNEGLIKAANRFDHTRGFKFISYAVWWIRQSILQHLTDHGKTIRIPLNKIGLMNKINKAIAILTHQTERTPTYIEIAEHLERPTYEIQYMLNSFFYSKSLDSHIDSNSEFTYLDILENKNAVIPDTCLLENDNRIIVKKLLSMLSEREAEIIIKRHGLFDQEKMTNHDIGVDLDITAERVRQIEERARKKLRSRGRHVINKFNVLEN